MTPFNGLAVALRLNNISHFLGSIPAQKKYSYGLQVVVPVSAFEFKKKVNASTIKELFLGNNLNGKEWLKKCS